MIQKAGIFALGLVLIWVEAVYHLKWFGLGTDPEMEPLFTVLTTGTLVLNVAGAVWVFWRFGRGNLGAYLFLVNGLIDLLDLMGVYVSAGFQNLVYESPYTRSALVLGAVLCVAVDGPRGSRAAGKSRTAMATNRGGFFALERAVLGLGKQGGLILMLAAIVWFYWGYQLGQIFFYPPVLFLFGLWGFIRSVTGITSAEERIALALSDDETSSQEKR